MRYTLRSFLCTVGILWVSMFTHPVFAREEAMQAGLISAVDLSARTIEINKKIYGLQDGLLVYSPQGELTSPLSLKVDQKINYALGEQSKAIRDADSQAPTVVVTKINILTGYDNNFKR